MKPLIAYHGNPEEKTAILAQLEAHARADEIVKGQYWEDGKGCAVGCTIHSDNHAEYEPRFGIPQMLARLEDTIFEGLPNAKAKTWPVRFMTAIEPGADLSCVGWRFLHWLLMDERVNPGINHPDVQAAVKQCAAVLEPLARGEPVDRAAAASAARSAAASAAHSAASAAHSARSAATSAEQAEQAAWAARSAAYSAAYSAADSAADSAYSAAYTLMSEKLLELIRAAPLAKEES